MDNSTRIVAEALAPSLLDSLAGLASFVINCPGTILQITTDLSPPKVLALSDLLLSRAEITTLFLDRMPVSAAAFSRLCPAIAQSGTVRSLTLGGFLCKSAPELDAAVLASATPTLEELDLANISLDKGTATALGRCAGLSRLRFFDCTTPYYPAAHIPEEISKLKLLTSVCFCRIRLADEGVRELAEGLSRLPLLRDLRLIHVQLKAGCGKALQPLLRLNRLEKLCLKGNDLGDTGVSAILGQTRPGCRLQKLNLESANFGPVGGLALAKAIPNLLKLRLLNIAFNKIGVEAAAAIGEAIRDAPSHHIQLEKLNIAECGLGQQGVASLFGPIKGLGSNLTTLKMGYNSAGELGIKAISKCLSGIRGTGLTTLLMDLETITEKEGAKMLSEMLLCKAYTLRVLSMMDNQVGPEMCAKIVDALPVGVCTMDKLDMSGCAAGNDGAFAVSRLIERRGCRLIVLSSNSIGAEGVAAIADSISGCTRGCTQLILSMNPLGNNGAKYLAEHVIQSDMALESLDLTGIGMGSEGAKAIADALSLREKKGKGALREIQCGEEGLKALDGLLRLGPWCRSVLSVSC